MWPERGCFRLPLGTRNLGKKKAPPGWGLPRAGDAGYLQTCQDLVEKRDQLLQLSAEVAAVE